MAKKKKHNKETTIENYYDLKVDKVDELVSVLKNEDITYEEISMNISDCTGIQDENSVTKRGKQKQFDPYKTDFLGRIPTWIKALFVKFWFAGAVCYFIVWGINIGDTLDSLVLTGIVLGLVVEMLVNPAFRFMETDAKEYNAYMMFPFPFKAYWTFFTNIIYYVVVLICVNYLYYGLNVMILNITGSESTIAVGVEPLLFATFTVIVDMAFIGIKDLIVYLVKKHKNNKREEANADV